MSLYEYRIIFLFIILWMVKILFLCYIDSIRFDIRIYEEMFSILLFRKEYVFVLQTKNVHCTPSYIHTFSYINKILVCNIILHLLYNIIYYIDMITNNTRIYAITWICMIHIYYTIHKMYSLKTKL